MLQLYFKTLYLPTETVGRQCILYSRETLPLSIRTLFLVCRQALACHAARHWKVHRIVAQHCNPLHNFTYNHYILIKYVLRAMLWIWTQWIWPFSVGPGSEVGL
jgi:hypothetical protein